MPPLYTVIGATDGPGLPVFLQLVKQGHQVLGIGRSAEKIQAITHFLDAAGAAGYRLLQQDFDSAQQVPDAALATNCLISASRPVYLDPFLDKCPQLERVVSIGSARIYTQFPDERCRQMQHMQARVLEGPAGTVIHPTLIYGGTGFNNIERIESIARLAPVIPLPQKGQALIQPVHVMDVARATLSAVMRSDTDGVVINLGGAEAIPYAEFVEVVAKKSGKRVRVIALPLGLLKLLAGLTALVPGMTTIGAAEVQRLMEDKDISNADAESLLGVKPIGLDEGLELRFGFDEALAYFWGMEF